MYTFPVYSSPGVSPSDKRVYGLASVLQELRKRRIKAGLDGKAETIVGYSAPYAVPVHERLDLFHPVGQAKFLEQPLRTEEKKMAEIIRSRLKARMTLKQAQVAAATHLLDASKELVPVDTGTLLLSGFIK